MNTRSLLATTLAASVASLGAFAACASDESPSLGDPDASERLGGPDAGLDVTSADAGADVHQEPCTPDALCPNDLFDPTNAGGALDLRTRITVIRGRSASDVWAAGADGVVIHFDGTSWTRLETGTHETMHELWLRDTDEVGFVSLASIHTRGLEPVDAGADAAPPSADGWRPAGKLYGTLRFSQASKVVTSAWTAAGAEWLWCANGLWRLRVDPSTNALEIGDVFTPGACDTLRCAGMLAIHGTSADDLWAVGRSGASVHITNAQGDAPGVTAFDTKTWAGLNGVWAASATDVWAVGGAGVIRHYTGKPSSWDVVPDAPTSATLRAVWGTSSTDVWAVGDGAVVLHYDGKSWSSVKVLGLSGRSPNLYTVWTPAPGRVWIGGDGVMLSLGGKP